MPCAQLEAPKVKEAVAALLRELAPKAEEFSVSMASDFAFYWIEQYHQALSQDKDDVDKQPRLELESLRAAIRKLEKKIETLSPAAKSALPKDWTFIVPFNEGTTRFKAVWVGMDDLGSMLKGAKRSINSGALRLAKRRPSKHWNRNNFLACGMHQVLGNMLHLKVAMAREGDPSKQRSTSANYWRLLRLALEQAGVEPPEDLLPTMKAGRKLVGPLLTQGHSTSDKRGKSTPSK